MSFKLAVAILASAWSVGLLQQASASQEPKTPAATAASVWAGAYTEEQAKVGLGLYVKHCSECHGEDLGGDGFAPALKGPEFMNNWNGLTVGELFDRVKISMPPANPSSVSAKEKADIIAYVLKQDGFPAGKTPLPATVEALKSIKFEATKPGVR